MEKNNQSQLLSGEKPHKEQSGIAESSESLDEYIRVGKPGIYVVLGAMLLVLAAVIIWGLIGKLPVTETVKALAVDTEMVKKYYQNGDMKHSPNIEAYLRMLAKEDILNNSDQLMFCFIDASRYIYADVEKFAKQTSMKMADQKNYTGEIAVRVGVPLSREECKEILFENEWVLGKCVTADYSWPLLITPDTDISDYELMMSDMTIITDEVAPISFLTR